MSMSSRMKTGTGWLSGEPYCELSVGGKTYIGRGATKEEAIKVAELAAYLDNQASNVKPPTSLNG